MCYSALLASVLCFQAGRQLKVTHAKCLVQCYGPNVWSSTKASAIYFPLGIQSPGEITIAQEVFSLEIDTNWSTVCNLKVFSPN